MMKVLMEKGGSPEGMIEVSEQLSRLFAKTPENKAKIQNLKYSVNFESLHWMQPVTSSATQDESVEPTGTNTSAVADEQNDANVMEATEEDGNGDGGDDQRDTSGNNKDNDSEQQETTDNNDESDKMVEKEEDVEKTTIYQLLVIIQLAITLAAVVVVVVETEM